MLVSYLLSNYMNNILHSLKSQFEICMLIFFRKNKMLIVFIVLSIACIFVKNHK